MHKKSLGRENNFEITTPSLVTTQAVPYDLGSVMHYGATAFSKNGEPTIVPVESSVPHSSLGQRNGLSGTDLQHVKTLYCSGTTITITIIYTAVGHIRVHSTQEMEGVLPAGLVGHLGLLALRPAMVDPDLELEDV